MFGGEDSLQLKGPEIIAELRYLLNLLTLCWHFSKKPFLLFLEETGYSIENVLLHEPKAGVSDPEVQWFSCVYGFGCISSFHFLFLLFSFLFVLCVCGLGKRERAWWSRILVVFRSEVLKFIAHSMQILKPAFTILADHETKYFLLLIRGTHSIKDTLTAATGAVVPFHHTVVHEGGVSNLVLGYAHCGMVAAARWIAKLSTPCLTKALGEYPDYKVKVNKLYGNLDCNYPCQFNI